VIEQASGIPQNPAKSLRNDFRKIVIKKELIKAVVALNLVDGKPSSFEDYLKWGITLRPKRFFQLSGGCKPNCVNTLDEKCKKLNN
jgi:hypothetical protein